MNKTLLSISEACQRLSIGRTKLYQFLNSGQIKAVRADKRTLIPVSAIEEFANNLKPFKVDD